MDDWEKINKNPLPEKEDFPSHLNIEDIIHVDYAHKKRGCRGFEVKKFRRISRLVCSKRCIIVSWCI